MIKAMKALLNDKRGNVLVIVGASLPLLVGSAGLATDTIQWVTWKRQLQRAADSAAFAGVYADLQNASVSTAVGNDLAHNNKTNMTLLGNPVITYPANTSTYSDAVSVQISVQQELGFSSLFMATPPTITATGVAAVVPTGEYCVISLEPTAITGITATGNASMDLGCGIITNSTSLDAAVATGSANVTASPVAAVGGINTGSDNWGEGTDFLPFTIPQDDPFADVTPTPPSPCNGGQVRVNPPGNGANSGTTTTLSEGCYSSMTLNGNVKLNPGTYYINGGDLSIGAQADIDGRDGVTFVLTNTSSGSNATIGNVHINGGARVRLSAPTANDTTGDTVGNFKDILIYQDRRANDGGSSTANLINGNSNSSFQGAFYFPSRVATFNGTSGMTTDCVQLVARRVEFSGNSSISNSCPSGGPSAFEGRHVRLVG